MGAYAESVVVADADGRERKLVAGALRRAGYETVEVENGFEALEAARAGGVGLVMLEVALPGLTGYEVCHELRTADGSELPILLVSSTKTDSLDRVAGLLLGADDYLMRPVESGEVLARIGRLLARQATSRKSGGSGSSTALTSMTQREGEVLRLLAGGRTQKEIAFELSISPKTVGTHLQKLMAKLGVHSRAELVARAYQDGLVAPSRDRRETTGA